MPHAPNSNEHLVKAPIVTRPRTTAAQEVNEALAELLSSAKNGLVRDGNAPLGERQLTIAKTLTEHGIQPGTTADDLSKKPVAIVQDGRSIPTKPILRGNITFLPAATFCGELNPMGNVSEYPHENKLCALVRDT